MVKKKYWFIPIHFFPRALMSAQRNQGEDDVWWQRELKKSLRNSRTMCNYVHEKWTWKHCDSLGYQLLYFLGPLKYGKEEKRWKTFFQDNLDFIKMQVRRKRTSENYHSPFLVSHALKSCCRTAKDIVYDVKVSDSKIYLNHLMYTHYQVA